MAVDEGVDIDGGDEDAGDPGDLSFDITDYDAHPFMDPDLAGVDGGAGYQADLAPAGGGGCVPPQMPMTCAAPISINAGCTGAELCGITGKGNGMDDNCDGTSVDEGCILTGGCAAGEVQRCFLGPPGKRGVGACTDGEQTCVQISETQTEWGPCLGSIGPSAERCDKLDNDCNGCADDGLCCGDVLNCPAPGDPRIAPKTPFTTINLMGGQFFTGAATSWTWKIVGGPCDRMFQTTTGTPAKQSFTLTNANAQNATATFTLSGDYTVTLTVLGMDGNTYECTWVQHIEGPGVRFELCWNHEGPSPNGADLDLHVHRSGTTTNWFYLKGMGPPRVNFDDCSYLDCTGTSVAAGTPLPNWSYAASPIASCEQSPSGMIFKAQGLMCNNPRLDIDNINSIGKPENTNIDNPANNDTFRAMVHYFGQNGARQGSVNDVEEHPIVNIYCGGALKASYGQAPNTLGPCPGPTCFNHGYGLPLNGNDAQLWRVADVRAQVDATGKTTGCIINPLHPPAATTGYWVTATGITY